MSDAILKLVRGGMQGYGERWDQIYVTQQLNARESIRPAVRQFPATELLEKPLTQKICEEK